MPRQKKNYWFLFPGLDPIFFDCYEKALRYAEKSVKISARERPALLAMLKNLRFGSIIQLTEGYVVANEHDSLTRLGQNVRRFDGKTKNYYVQYRVLAPPGEMDFSDVDSLVEKESEAAKVDAILEPARGPDGLEE